MAQTANPSKKRKLDEGGDRTFQLVVAASRKLGIGLKGALPWKLPPDMAHFKNITTNTDSEGARNAVIMGRRARLPCRHQHTLWAAPGSLSHFLSH